MAYSDFQYPVPQPELPPEPRRSWLAENRKFAILGATLVLLVAAIATVSFLRGRQEPGTANQNSSVNESASTTGTPSTRGSFDRYTPDTTTDQDRDGLTDEEERTAASDPNDIDTDGDGLTDYEEVKVYRTKPTVSDTDADGTPDGREVASGLNPAGAGSLLDLTNAIKQLEQD